MAARSNEQVSKGTVQDRNGFRFMCAKLSLPVVLLLSACSSGTEADLQYIKQARSTAAEWALVNEQVSEGKLTPTYVSTMHQALREQLRTSASELSEPQSDYGREITSLLKEPDDATQDGLRAHVNRLKQIEDSLESA